MTSTRRVLVESAGSALGGYVLGASLETAIIHWVKPTEWALAWVSDVFLAGALGVAVYLWRHLLATRHELAEHERAELVLETQLSLAADIQRRFLPPLPPPTNGFEWAARLKSAGKIGGDFFDFVQTAPNVWVVLVADISGKGIPAAMAIGSLRAAFRALARQGLEPARIVSELSADLLQDWGGVPYVTCVVLSVDLQSRTIVYTNAGHPAGILVERERVEYLERGGPPAGLLPGIRFDQGIAALDAGATCLLVSDGVTEALDGTIRLEELIAAGNGRSSAVELCDTIMARALGGRGPAGVGSWDDDRTVVVVKALH
jgi:serine phosphatase RsbU (regulator of sigma subunit)